MHLGFTIFAERTVPPFWGISRRVERAAPDRALHFRASKRWNLLARQFVFCSSSRGTGPFYGGLVFLETRLQARRISSAFIGIGGWCLFLWTSKDSFSWSGFPEIDAQVTGLGIEILDNNVDWLRQNPHDYWIGGSIFIPVMIGDGMRSVYNF